jgi:hypothetical protein
VSSQAAIRRIDDWLNPIVVKELRQAVQGKFVYASLLLLLTIQLASLGLYIISNGDFAEQYDAGRTAFIFLLAILMAICLLFIPAYTAVRLAFERDTNVDLLFVTTIKPSAIVWGKMFAALTITVLVFSACLPFMVFTYWLRGIDLPSIFILMASSFLVVTVAVQLATFVACIQAGRVLKILLSLFLLILFLQAYVVTLTWSVYELQSGVGSRMATWRFWGPACFVLMIAAAAIGLLFSLSVAMIKPVSSNRAMPVRLFVSGMWLLSFLASSIISYFQRDNTPLSVWGIISVVVFAGGFFVSVSEREQLGARVARTIPSSWLRLPAFFLFSGAAGGVAWSALMSLLTYMFFSILTASSRTLRTGSSLKDIKIWIAGLALYGLAYAMSALLARRYMLSRWVASKYTWLVGLLLLAAGCILPFLVGYMVAFGSFKKAADIGAWLVTNPFVLGLDEFQDAYLIFAAGWAALMGLLNADWFIEQIKAFRPAGAVGSPAFRRTFVDESSCKLPPEGGVTNTASGEQH